MQELTYASKCIITTDDVVAALVDLVTAIDRQEHSEAVVVPAFTEDGGLLEARMTLDASSELVAVPMDQTTPDGQEVHDAIAVAIEDIRSRITRNRSSRVSIAYPSDTGDDLTDFNDL
ncbi:hypothetical protein HQQ80_19770 [Microbacteriaceae bacterium VKM Ac-2855]|nr:hypothetical protein [Microbacteriaceae bacterium VKM Ac-2855]